MNTSPYVGPITKNLRCVPATGAVSPEPIP
jgi:hypothetical protein